LRGGGPRTYGRAVTVPAPIFLLDSNEKFQPIAVESVEHSGATIVDANGKNTNKPVSLAALPASGGRMDFPKDAEAQEKRLRARFGNVGYHRTLTRGGLTWDQYWLWYLYNPKVFVHVTGNHEGDWEFVQIGSVAGTPVCMTNSQHQTGSARMWWDVELRDSRPVVYVAVGSHANFFAPVSENPDIGDDGDGKGAVLDALEWREFGDWATWPGHWGNSTGQGQSPSSPGQQGARWSAPQKYHSFATGRG
jgi:hypothetical protein